jgi:hypothetical protein
MSDWGILPRLTQNLFPIDHLIFAFRTVISKLDLISPDFSLISNEVKYDCQLTVVAACYPPLFSAFLANPNLTEFPITLSEAQIPLLLKGQLTTEPFTKLNNFNFTKILNQFPPLFIIKTLNSEYSVHRILALTLCQTDLSTTLNTTIDLSELAKYLSGAPLSIDRSNFTIIQTGAKLLGMEPLMRQLASLSKKFAVLDRSFAVSSLHQWLLALEGFSYSDISDIVKSSVFYQDPSQHYVIAEFLPIAALVRPFSGELYLQLIEELNSNDEFKSTLRRVCLSDLFKSEKSNWLLYRLFKSGLFSIKDVMDSKTRVSAQHSWYWSNGYGIYASVSLCWFLPEIQEFDPVEYNNILSGSLMARGNEPLFTGPQEARVLTRKEELEEFRTLGFHPDPLISALRTDNVDALDAILSSSLEIELGQPIPPFVFERSSAFASHGLPIIAIAMFYGSVRCVKALLMRHVEINHTVARYAMMSGNPEMIRLVEQYIEKGPSGASITLKRHRNSIFQWLMENDRIYGPCEPSLEGRRFDRQQSLLEATVQSGNLEAFLYFFEYGIDFKSLPGISNLVLATAIGLGHTEIVKLLLTIPGIDPGQLSGHTADYPLTIALALDRREIAKILIADPRCKVHCWDSHNRTPFGIAASNQDPELIRMLMERLNPEELLTEKSKLSEQLRQFVEGLHP